tara:strand:- start:465 stop:1193 length:729 start_codon:yes stop_codon:yes gene_type:complete
MDTYRDPKRKIGSQSETPKIKVKGNEVIVSGYQNFNINTITKQITFKGPYHDKFSYINRLFDKLNKEGCNNIVDIGCNSGLCSFIAYNSNFKDIVSLDHDSEYISTLASIKQHTSITNINESTYSFGDVISEKYDVVFCGAIIHWIFSLTADFRNFDSIVRYLMSFTKKYIVIEWVDTADPAIKSLNHIKKRQKKDDEEYNTNNFEKAIKKYTEIVSMKPIKGRKTRVIYVLRCSSYKIDKK